MLICSWITYSQNTVLPEKYPLGWHISTCHCTGTSWQCQIKILLFKKIKKKKKLLLYFHKYVMILITSAQKSTQKVNFLFFISVPWIKCYYFFPGRQYIKYIFHSVTKLFKKFVQDSTGPCQINVTYLIFQVRSRCLSWASHQSVLTSKNLCQWTLCLATQWFCSVTLIIWTACKMQPSAKKEI